MSTLQPEIRLACMLCDRKDLTLLRRSRHRSRLAGNWRSELKAKLDEHMAQVDIALDDLQDQFALVQEQAKLVEARLIGLARTKRQKS